MSCVHKEIMKVPKKSIKFVLKTRGAIQLMTGDKANLIKGGCGMARERIGPGRE